MPGLSDNCEICKKNYLFSLPRCGFCHKTVCADCLVRVGGLDLLREGLRPHLLLWRRGRRRGRRVELRRRRRMSSPEAPTPSRPSRFGRFFWRDPNTQFLLLAAVVGLLGALGAIAFRFVTGRVTDLLMGAHDVVSAAEGLPIALRVFFPAAGGFVGGLVIRHYMVHEETHGISEMIEVVSLGRRSVRMRPAVARVVSSIAVISTGGSEGREGPIIQIGAAMASSVSRRLKLSPERVRILTACGMAAGVAGAYNTPIAATLFVLEVVVGSFSMTLFGPAVVSAVLSTVLVRFALGDEPVYKVAAFHLESVLELIPFAAIGLAAGPCSALFVRSLRFAKKMFASPACPSRSR